VTGLALTAMPAAAIIGGTQDTGNKFRNTGLVLNNGHHWCSGALYRTDHSSQTSTLFMTAAHCTLGYAGPFSVTFDPAGDTVPGEVTIPAVHKYSIPGYASAVNGSNSLQNGNDVPDVAVLVLAYAPAGIVPADLPSQGLVDTLDFKTQMISAAGYGINDFSKANFSSGSYSIGARYYKETGITPGQRTQTAVYLKAEASTCYGDSGGPNFLYGQNTLIGDTVWGQSVICSDHNYINRIDTSDALYFLNNPTSGVTN
jgi:hypothetical protein